MKHGVTKRQIVAAADNLFYRQGYEHTSFSDISSAVNITRGNLYHHFKAKDDILEAVIGERLRKTRETLGYWQTEGGTPQARIECYLRSLLDNWSMIEGYGCPVGSFCTELAKLEHSAHENSVEIFALFRQWLKSQFLALNTIEDPDALALQALTWGQGVASICNAFKDYQFAVQEVQRMRNWLKALPVASAIKQ